ncbi:MAG TPA: DNA repair helicase XPB, partial [Planctomycetota bacterium]|nr:DNA repair helicase XPB [Planctomycetota bacterium]
MTGNNGGGNGNGKSPGNGGRPLTVQGDRTILAEVQAPGFAEARDYLALFAELKKCPEYVHTYEITPLSIWNAAAAGLSADAIIDFLAGHSRYPVPAGVERDIRENIRRFGLLSLQRRDGRLVLTSSDTKLLAWLANQKPLKRYFDRAVELPDGLAVLEAVRGEVKQALIQMNYPVEDLAGYEAGAELGFELRTECVGSGKPFALRPYQVESAEVFHAGGTEKGGSGVVVLPCGAGKTIVGMACAHRLQTQTLILTTNTIAVRQWRSELLDKTTLRPEDVGEYTGDTKEVRPVTISTYQMLTYRRRQDGEFTHFALFTARNWGLVVYDEVHLLPAPVFRVTAGIQARRRLGLTATLVREDGREDEVFSLIGPKKFDVPWKTLERQGWIATAHCVELRLPLDEELYGSYLSAGSREKFRIASENPGKLEVAARLAARHRDDRVLIIGQYLDQLDLLAERLSCPLITGRTPTRERETLYERFRSGDLGLLAVSKVGNFAVDLPDANVAVQVSGTFGSRQEEAQRLGRILRPKCDGSGAVFYSVVTLGSRDQEFAER